MPPDYMYGHGVKDDRVLYASLNGREYGPLSGSVEIGLDDGCDVSRHDFGAWRESVTGELTFANAAMPFDLAAPSPAFHLLIGTMRTKGKNTKQKIWMYRHDRKGRSRWIRAGRFEPTYDTDEFERVAVFPIAGITEVRPELSAGVESPVSVSFRAWQ